jgi:hypothetical protein
MNYLFDASAFLDLLGQRQAFLRKCVNTMLPQTGILVLLLTPALLGPAVLGQSLPPTPEIAGTPSPGIAAKRVKRDSRFNDTSHVLPKLDELKPNEGYGRSGAHPVRIAPNPVDRADAIVIGHVTHYESHFSGDHTAIYTEFYIEPERVLKGDAEDTYELVVFGGSIKKADGRVITDSVDSYRMPRLDTRYVLFLKRDSDAEAYFPLKLWKLEDRHPIPVNPDDRSDAAAGRSSIVRMSEDEFLSAIVEEINLPSGEQQQ